MHGEQRVITGLSKEVKQKLFIRVRDDKNRSYFYKNCIDAYTEKTVCVCCILLIIFSS